MRKITTAVLFVLLVSTSCSTPEPEFDLSLLLYDLERVAGYREDVAPPLEVYPENGFDWQLLADFDRNVRTRPDSALSPFYGMNLSILVPDWWNFTYRFPEIVNSFERMHPGVSVELIFPPEDEDEDEEEEDDGNYIDLVWEFIIDSAPVLIYSPVVQYPIFESNDGFADWMPVLVSHPGFDENDWNMNVLSASRINGELIAFPAFQFPLLVSVNRTIPGLASFFDSRDYITYEGLLEIYSFFGAGSGFYFMHTNLVGHIWTFYLFNFFDYESRKIRFYSDEFIELLYQQYDIQRANLELPDVIFRSTDLDEIMGDVFYFRFHFGFMMDFEVFSVLDYVSNFINPLPLVTNDGVLRLAAGNNSSWILNTQDPVYQALAADFLLFIAGVFGQGVSASNSPFYIQGSWWSFGIPAKHSGFRNVEPLIRQRIAWNFENVAWRYDSAYAAEVFSGLAAHLGSMEMRRDNVMPRNIQEIIIEELSDFEHGLTTARQAASRLQNRVELALMAGG